MVNYFYGKDCHTKEGINKECNWSKFIKGFETPHQSNISFEEMVRLSNIKEKYLNKGKELTEQELKEKTKAVSILTQYKNVHYIICGKFSTNTRSQGDKNLLFRNVVALDIDSCDTGIWDKLKALKKYTYLLHTSFSHTPNKPKIRVFIPLTENISGRELYKDCVSNFIYSLGLKIENKAKNIQGEVDNASTTYNQLMFLPNVSKGGEYIFQTNEGNLLDLKSFKSKEQVDLTDFEQPEPPGELYEEVNNSESSTQPDINKVKSPYDMEEGIIKKFCLDYPISKCISTFLNTVYIDRLQNRYTYNLGSNQHGAVVYPDKHGNKEVFLYSNHSSDPLNDGRLHNSFNLLKIHNFNGDVKQTIKFIEGLYESKEEPIDLDSIIESGESLFNRLSEIQEEYINASVYKTGFKQLDTPLGGGLRNFLYVLGAGSSMGKTTFIQQLADNIAQNGNHVVYVTMEQTKTELISKTISRNTYLIDKDLALSATEVLEGKQCCHLNDALDNAREYQSKIWYYEADFGTNLLFIDSLIKAYIEKYNVKPCLIIDYLQALGNMEDKFSDTKHVTDENIKKLKHMAKHNKIPVIALSSLNRNNYLLPISYESFKESGAIEFTADCIMGLQYSCVENFEDGKDKVRNRLELSEQAKKPIREIELVILKNRQGVKEFKVGLKYSPKYNYFEEVKKFTSLLDGLPPSIEPKPKHKTKRKTNTLDNNVKMKEELVLTPCPDSENVFEVTRK